MKRFIKTKALLVGSDEDHFADLTNKEPTPELTPFRFDRYRVECYNQSNAPNMTTLRFYSGEAMVVDIPLHEIDEMFADFT